MSYVTVKLELRSCGSRAEGSPLSSVELWEGNHCVSCLDEHLSFARDELDLLIKHLDTTPFEATITEVTIE